MNEEQRGTLPITTAHRWHRCHQTKFERVLGPSTRKDTLICEAIFVFRDGGAFWTDRSRRQKEGVVTEAPVQDRRRYREGVVRYGRRREVGRTERRGL